MRLLIVALLLVMAALSATAKEAAVEYDVVFTNDPVMFKGEAKFYRVGIIYYDTGECVIEIIPTPGEPGGYFTDGRGNQLAKLMGDFPGLDQTWFTIDQIRELAIGVCWPEKSDVST